jgi:hypothetical protein
MTVFEVPLLSERSHFGRSCLSIAMLKRIHDSHIPFYRFNVPCPQGFLHLLVPVRFFSIAEFSLP